MLAAEDVSDRREWLDMRIVEGVVPEVFVGEFQPREASEVAVVGHHVVAFFVVVSLAFWVGVARRVVSYPVEGTVSFDGVGDLVIRGSFESLCVGLSEGFKGALICCPVALGVDSVVWPLVVVGEPRCRIQAVDNVGIDELRLSLLSIGAAPAPRLVGRVEKVVIVRGRD